MAGLSLPTVGGYGGQTAWGPGNPEYDAWKAAWDLSQQAANAGLNRVPAGQFLGSNLGQAAQQRFIDPKGFNPKTLEAMRSMRAQQAAGAKKSQIENFRARAATSGFGGGVEEARLASQIEAQNAQDLNNALTELDWLNEQARMQEMGIGAGLSGNLASLDSGQNIAYLQAQMSRQFPAIGGITNGGTGQPQWRYVDPRTGGIKPRPMGLTALEQEQWDTAAREERMRWLAQQGQQGQGR